MRLGQTNTIKLVVDDPFLDDSLTKPVSIDTVHEVLFIQPVALADLTDAGDRLGSGLEVRHDLLHPKQLVLA